MKAVLVIDMPDVCCSTNETCDLCVDKDWGPICAKTGRDVLWGQKPDWCPLRPLPEKREMNNAVTTTLDFWAEGWMAKGWNDCLDEITGGNDETPGDD